MSEQQLHKAISRGDDDKVASIMEAAGSNAAKLALLEAKSKRAGMTALLLAVDACEDMCVTVLLRHGADANAEDEEGQSALQLACSKGSPAVASALLDAGARATGDARDVQIAHSAVLRRMRASLKRLQQAGVGMEAEDPVSGHTPLITAIANADADTAKVLMVSCKVDVNRPDMEGNTPLHHAVKAGDLPSAELLLSRSADVNAQNAHGQTALHIAYEKFKRNAGAFARLMEEHGVDKSLKDYRGLTAEEVVEAAERDRELQAEREFADRQRREKEKQERSARTYELDPEVADFLSQASLLHLEDVLAPKRLDLEALLALDAKKMRRYGLSSSDKDILLGAIEQHFEQIRLAAEEGERLLQQQLEDQVKQRGRLRWYALAGFVVVLAVLYVYLDYVTSRKSWKHKQKFF